MPIRTDLAIEAEEILRTKNLSNLDFEGILKDVKKDGRLTITKIDITNEKAQSQIGRKKGKYITIEAPGLCESIEDYEKSCYHIKKIVSELLGEKSKRILVAGLGNDKITPDSLGPRVIKDIIVTRHLKKMRSDFFGEEFSEVSAIAPGVLGTTGVESADVIKGVLEKTTADALVVIDALCSRSMDRICNSIQISTAGIEPGAGVGNRRDEISEQTLGIKVIAIGIPTVIDAATIVYDSVSGDDEIIEKKIYKNAKNFFVTPRDIDAIIKRASMTLSTGINMALHPGIDFSDVQSLVM